jgi:hypothetical protein
VQRSKVPFDADKRVCMSAIEFSHLSVSQPSYIQPEVPTHTFAVAVFWEGSWTEPDAASFAGLACCLPEFE